LYYHLDKLIQLGYISASNTM